jgi:HAMP domain-containing protein
MAQSENMGRADLSQPTESNQRRGAFISLRVKILISFSLLFSVVFAAAFYWFFTFASNVAQERLRINLHDAIISAGENIDGDVLLALAQEGEPNEAGFSDDLRYWEIADWLHNVHETLPDGWPYTYIEGEAENEIIYVVSSGALEEPAWGVSFLESEITDSNRPQMGLESPQTFLDQPYEWQDTLWVSGYAPIRSFETGEVIGGVGIDYRLDYLLNVRRDILNLALPAFVITYGVLFVMVFFMSTGLSRPIISLTRVAEHIGEGDYQQDFNQLNTGYVRDEITTLSEVFQVMIGKVEKREVRLKEKVAELQIIVDKSKRDEQVSEIVDSDFFQDLQVKASEMRKRKNRPKNTEEVSESET